MLLIAIIACEVGFWLVLAAGLAARYVLRRRRLGAVLLASVPLVDLALLLLTVVDLSRGAQAELAHGLVAVYLGFSLAFGPALVRWADVHVADRLAGGPSPTRKPQSGTSERASLEWRDFGRACAAVGLSALLLLGAIALVGDSSDTAPLWAWLPRLGLLLVVWFVAWPGWESARVLLGNRAGHPR